MQGRGFFREASRKKNKNACIDYSKFNLGCKPESVIGNLVAEKVKSFFFSFSVHCILSLPVN